MPDPILRDFSPIGCVKVERIKQDVKWGEQNHSDLKWLSILGEEFGEVAKAVTEDNPAKERLYTHEALQDNLEYELIQVAAVCVAWVECIRRNEKKATP
jgi:NTP pyrophosphatase (non-canonical NTP hydrolase)